MALQHDRTIDHSGTEDTTTVTISSVIGPHPVGTTLQVVLADFATRIVALETGARRFGTFRFDAFIQPYFKFNAVLKKTPSSTFTLNAVLTLAGNKSFTLNAAIRRGPTTTFTLDAFLV